MLRDHGCELRIHSSLDKEHRSVIHQNLRTRFHVSNCKVGLIKSLKDCEQLTSEYSYPMIPIDQPN